MAKKATKKQSGSTKARSRSKAGASASRGSKSGGAKSGQRSKAKRQPKSESGMSASDALVGLLESPLVADILAAGAAAALGAVAQRGFSRRDEGRSTRAVLSAAAKAAAAAMGARIAEEIDEIVKSSSESRREEA